MPTSPRITLTKIRRDFGHRVSAHAPRTSPAASITAFLRLREHCPYFSHSCSASWQHAILHAVQVAAVDGWHEAAGDKAEDDPRCEVVLAEAVAELEVLIEHGT